MSEYVASDVRARFAQVMRNSLWYPLPHHAHSVACAPLALHNSPQGGEMAEQPRFLIVECHPTDCEPVVAAVRAGFPSALVQCACGRDGLLEGLATFGPDLVLANCTQPEVDGPTLLALTSEHAPLTPVVVLASCEKEDAALACLSAGAWACVLREHLTLLGATLRDVLERKRLRGEHRLAEEEARERGLLFRQLFEVAAVPLCVVDQSAGTLDFNGRFTEVFGYTAQDLPTIGEWWTRALPDEVARGKAIARCESVGPNGQLTPLELEVTCKDGSRKSVVLNGSVLGSDVLLAFFDVTDRRSAEDALQRKVLELERFNRAMVDRELRIIELKREINRLLAATGQSARYRIVE